jgi:hypothetical protein
MKYIMGTLANTTWSIVITGETTGTMSVIFNETGTAFITFPNKVASTAYWAECVDGSFVFQLTRTVDNPTMVKVFFGTYNETKGKGQWNGLNNSHGAFTMTRNNE